MSGRSVLGRKWWSPQTYFLGDAKQFGATHRRYAAKRRQKLEAAGLREGRDFVVHPKTGRLYSFE